jgi:hypothetical protein
MAFSPLNSLLSGLGAISFLFNNVKLKLRDMEELFQGQVKANK